VDLEIFDEEQGMDNIFEYKRRTIETAPAAYHYIAM